MSAVTAFLRLIVRLSLCLALLTSALGCGSEGRLTSPSPTPQPAPVPPQGPRLAAGLSINAVTINQAVGIDLYRQGAEPEVRNAPIVVGRAALVRVHVTLADDWQPRPVLGQLIISSVAEGTTALFEDEIEVEVDSEAADFDTTFDFVLSADDVGADTRVAVRLWETDDPDEEQQESSPASADAAAWPPLGSRALSATDWGGVLRVKVLPFVYLSDDSERLPDTSPAQVEIFIENLTRLYPLREVDLEVLDAYPTEIELLSDGTGFSDLLSLVADLREEWDIPFDTYVFGLVAPSPSQAEFCQLGCTAGMAYRLANPRNAKFKAGLGLGYSGPSAGRTLAHELGHSHDRPHAPCGGAGNADPDFPYEGGGIGVPGWDIVNEQWLAPEEHADVMGYCTPDWISDYTYGGLHRRIAAVEGLREAREALPSSPWLSFELEPGGTLRRPQVSDFGFLPEGPAVTVQFWDERGQKVGDAEGSLIRHGGAGGVVVLAAPALAVAAVSLGDSGLLQLAR